jgi:arabinofuranosyltransferase
VTSGYHDAIARQESSRLGASADVSDRGASRLEGGLRRIAPATLVLAMALVVVFFVHARAWAFVCDDAFISFRYAVNLAEHGALLFNVGMQPPERVEGYTNFAWVVVLAGFARVGVEPHVIAPVLTRLGAFVALVAITVLVASARRRRTPTSRPLEVLDLVPAMLLVASPELMVWAHGGLETSVAAALCVAAMAAWMRGRIIWAAGLAAAAGLTRVDTLLPVAAFGLAWLLVEVGPNLWRDRLDALRTVPWRRVAIASAVFAVPLVVHLLWRRAYYGSWVPNTFVVKAHGAALRDTHGLAYVQAWTAAVHLLWLAPLLLAVRPRHLCLLLPAGAVVLYGWSVGGDFMAYGRFYVVATMLLAGAVGWVLADAVAWLSRVVPARAAWWRTGALVVAAAAMVALGIEARGRWADDRAKPTGWLDGKWEGITAMDRFARVGLSVGAWMRDNLPPRTLISVGAAGAVPYASGLPVIDAFGLVDPYLSRMPDVRPNTGKRARPGHQLFAPPSYVRERDPDLLCHVGHRGPTRPSERTTHPAFSRGYVWACIEPEPVRDATSPSGWLDVGFYCCRRPVDRVVGPFGAEAQR